MTLSALLQFFIIAIVQGTQKRVVSVLIENNQSELKLAKNRKEIADAAASEQRESLTYKSKAESVKKLEEEIESMKREAETLNSTDTFVKYSKMQRLILKQQKTLETEKKELEELPRFEENQTTPVAGSGSAETSAASAEETETLNRLQIKAGRLAIAQKLLNSFLPVLFVMVLSAFPIMFEFDARATIWPISSFVGNQITPFMFVFSNTIWVIVCFRVFAIISPKTQHKSDSEASSNLKQTQEQPQDAAQKSDKKHD